MKNSLNLFDSDSLKDFHKRIFFSMIIFLFVYVIAIYRISDVMLFSNNIEFKEVLQKTSVRGKILDINGNLLATTVKSNSLSTNPNKIKNKAKLANQLSLILNIEKEKIIKKLNKNTHFVWIKRNITPKEHQKIIDLGEINFKSNLATYCKGFWVYFWI